MMATYNEHPSVYCIKQNSVENTKRRDLQGKGKGKRGNQATGHDTKRIFPRGENTTKSIEVYNIL